MRRIMTLSTRGPRLRIALYGMPVFFIMLISHAFASEPTEICNIYINSDTDSIIDNNCSSGSVVRVIYKFKSDAFDLKNHPSAVCDHSKTIFAQTNSEEASSEYIVSCLYAGSSDQKVNFFELIQGNPKDNEESAAWKYRKKGP